MEEKKQKSPVQSPGGKISQVGRREKNKPIQNFRREETSDVRPEWIPAQKTRKKRSKCSKSTTTDEDQPQEAILKNNVNRKNIKKRKTKKKNLDVAAAETAENVQCPLCSIKILKKNKHTLKKHIQRVHEQKKKCVCSICNSKFFGNWELKRHMIRHAEEKLFKCPVCFKKFKSKDSVRKHMRTLHKGSNLEVNYLPATPIKVAVSNSAEADINDNNIVISQVSQELSG